MHELFRKLGSCFREDFRNGGGPSGGCVEQPLLRCGLDLPNDRSWPILLKDYCCLFKVLVCKTGGTESTAMMG
ncbi:MAG: hypothetical protein ACRETH_12395, partial [Steroidobacteraceae bacterium]